MNSNSYRPPGELDTRWVLPEPAHIVSDLRDCGCSVDLMLELILEAHLKESKTVERDRKILLGSLLYSVKSDPKAHEDWLQAIAVDEERQLLELELNVWKAASMKNAGGAAMSKFLLERRNPDKFGKGARRDDDEETEEERKLREDLEALRNRGNQRRAT